ncbi:MAG: hypothetical protein K6E67_00380 [Prevotella sp.]|jgi:drug/metabolite transporter (DMT)-like permease|nr:hypothetical protein [Prevotella sp.]
MEKLKRFSVRLIIIVFAVVLFVLLSGKSWTEGLKEGGFLLIVSLLMDSHNRFEENREKNKSRLK